MTMKIIYQNGTGVGIITPCECGLTIEEIAAKDVPPNTPFLIVEDSAIPSDRTNRDQWQWSENGIVVT